MTYDRLDHGCKAKVLHADEHKVLLTATWPATKRDERKGFNIVGGVAHNTVVVSREYFDRKYGAVL